MAKGEILIRGPLGERLEKKGIANRALGLVALQLVEKYRFRYWSNLEPISPWDPFPPSLKDIKSFVLEGQELLHRAAQRYNCLTTCVDAIK